MNWILLSCLAVAGLSALALAADCDDKEPPKLCEAFPSAPAISPKPQKPKPFDCNNCMVDAIARQFGEPNIWIPKCDAKTDAFLRVQYNDKTDESFCVSKYGAVFDGSRIKGTKVDCSKYKEPAPAPTNVKPMAPVGCLVEAAKAKKEGKKLVHQCDKNGDYLAKQCFPNGGWCWCADTDGVPVPKTFFNNKMPVAKQPNCESHRKTKYDCKNKDGPMDHPFDCSRYIICAPRKAYNCICPKGQIFDTKLRLCNWDTKAVCPANKTPWQKL